MPGTLTDDGANRPPTARPPGSGAYSSIAICGTDFRSSALVGGGPVSVTEAIARTGRPSSGTSASGLAADVRRRPNCVHQRLVRVAVVPRSARPACSRTTRRSPACRSSSGRRPRRARRAWPSACRPDRAPPFDADCARTRHRPPAARRRRSAARPRRPHELCVFMAEPPTIDCRSPRPQAGPIPTEGASMWTKGRMGRTGRKRSCRPLPAVHTIKDVGSRRHHRGRGAVGAVRRHCRQAAQPRLPGARAGRARQLDLPVSAADGVLHDAGTARDRRPAVHVAVREADAGRGAELLPQGRRQVRPADRVRRGRGLDCPGRRRGAGRTTGSIFAIETRSSRGVRRVRHARHVVLAIGYFDRPVMLGIPGEDLPHVHHYYSEPHPYYRQRVVVVGGGNSAAESSLEMYRAGAHVTLVHRHAELKSTIKYWVRPDIDNRIKEESIAARFNTCVTEIRPTSVVVTGDRGHRGDSRRRGVPADRLSCGFGPDGARRRRRSTSGTRRITIPRRSRRTCQACLSPAVRSPATTPARSSSRTAASTARKLSR